VSVFVDRGTTPVAKASALTAAREATAGRVIAVVDRACSVTDALADTTIATHGRADESLVTDAVAKVLAVMKTTSGKPLRVVTEKLTGIARAILAAQQGDVVVACGLDASEPMEHRVSVSASEEQLVQALLHELAQHHRDAA
jgi:formylmethanofuran dehydrogenase subunit B